MAEAKMDSIQYSRRDDSGAPKQTIRVVQVWRLLIFLMLTGVLTVAIYTSVYQMADIETSMTVLLHDVKARVTSVDDKAAPSLANMVFRH
jgi:hypothetical protein